jgi:lysine-N-methylase
MQKKLNAPAYMLEFHCLGGDCEDTCCQNWDINLDKVHYDLLLSKVKAKSKERDFFNRNILLHDKNNTSESNYAYIKMQETGYCPFYSDSGLCDIHDKYGIEPLNDTCTFFPRVFSQWDNMAEMTGALSCPEIVRKCLFSDDTDHRMVDADINILPRPVFPVSRIIETDNNSYNSKFLDVRKQMLSIMSDSNFSFEARLYFLANFSYRLASHYHQGCQDNRRVDEEIKRIQSPEIKNQLDDYFFKFSNAEPVAIVVIQAILQLRIQHEGNDKLSQLAKDILQKYRINYQRSEDFDVYGENIPPDVLSDAFQQNWDELNTRFGVVLEEYFSRYVINCLQREWFISMPDPFSYIHMLTIRIGVLRFLITSHPDIIALLSADRSEQNPIDKFNEKIVEILYLYARSIDHNHAFLHVVYQAMLEQQMMSFDYSLAFIKF